MSAGAAPNASTPDVAVIGGGLAGGAAACLLAQAGRHVVLFEREAAAHDKVCGEFLSGEAAEYLEVLGIEPAALGAARIGGVRLVHGDAAAAEAALPFPAWGLSRRALDAALLDRAEALGADIRRGQGVRAVATAGAVGVVADGIGLVLDQGDTVRPRVTILATGKHDLRGARRHPRQPPEDFVGLKLHLSLQPQQAADLAGWVELFLFAPGAPSGAAPVASLQGGYAGLQMVEDGRANLCMLLPGAALPRDPGGAGWPALAGLLGRDCPLLGQRLANARPLLARAPAVARIPYGYVHQVGADGAGNLPGLYRLGDQAGVIPSFCGDGMAIALHSAFLAADCLRRNQDAAAYHRAMRQGIAGQVARAGLVGAAGRRWPGGLVTAARLAPGALRLAARLTRVPHRQHRAVAQSVAAA